MHYTNTYKEIGLTSEVLGATPWKQIQLLLNKTKHCIAEAHTAIENKNVTVKIAKINKAHDIIVYLRSCLDFEANPELSEKLEGIYRHLGTLLFQANAKNDAQPLDEASRITANLIDWWSKLEQ